MYVIHCVLVNKITFKKDKKISKKVLTFEVVGCIISTTKQTKEINTMTTTNAMMMVTLANASSEITLSQILCGVGLALVLVGITVAVVENLLRR